MYAKIKLEKMEEGFYHSLWGNNEVVWVEKR